MTKTIDPAPSSDGPERKNGEFIEGLARGLSILEAFDRKHVAMTLSEVARRTDMSPAAARRGLHTLARLGYIRQTERKFVLSARVLTLASSYLQAAGSSELLLPELQRLVGVHGDAASVAVLDGTNILYVAHYSEERARRAIASIGAYYPAHATSLGKVLLAGLTQDRLAEYFAKSDLRQLTDRTITGTKQLLETIEVCRRDGYATSVDELDYGIISLAVPVRNVDGQVLAAVNCSGYTGRLSVEQLLDERLEQLRLTANRIGRVLDSNPALAQSFVI